MINRLNVCSDGPGQDQHRSTTARLPECPPVAGGHLRRACLALIMIGLLAAGCSSTSRPTSSLSRDTPAFVFDGEVLPAGNVAYNPYNTDFEWPDFDGFVFLPLVWVPGTTTTRYGKYYPELATSWSSTPSALTIHLRAGARWQNGMPFTSRDVRVSLLLDGEQLDPFWSELSGVRTPNAHTVVLTLRKGANPRLVLPQVMQDLGTIVPASQYGRLAPASVEQDVIRYWDIDDPLHPTATSESAAQASPQAKALNSLDAALVKFEPSAMIGTGPYRLARRANAEVVLRKWDGFWDAKSIHVPTVDIEGLSNAGATSALLTGHLDWDSIVLPTGAALGRAVNTPHLHLTAYSAPQQIGLLLSQTHYPMNLLPVRRALAYLINRRAMVKLDTAGGPVTSIPTIAPDGLESQLATVYLTRAQRNRLNPYSYDPSKAASLLRSAGFNEKAGSWYTPQGSLFEVTIYASNSVQTMDEDAIIIADALKRFGIKASAADVGTTFFATSDAGGYAISETYATYGTTDPMTNFDPLLSEFYKATGLPSVVRVPGIGRVHPPLALGNEVTNISDQRQWRKLTWAWAHYVNSQLPYIDLYQTKIIALHSSEHFAHWPRAGSPLWEVGLDHGDLLTYLMQKGYIRPRS